MPDPNLLTPSEATISAAANALSDGDLIIVPTDTVYGIAADAQNAGAVSRIFEAKVRPADQPLQLLCSAGAGLGAIAVMSPAARQVVDGIGPGGWTVIVRKAAGWVSPALGGGDSVGIRMPDHSVTQAVLDAFGGAVAATSANVHGNPSPVTSAAAVSDVGAFCALAVDAGPAPEGLDSTVIDCTSDVPVILREGAIDRHTVARILGLATIEVVRSVRPEGIG